MITEPMMIPSASMPLQVDSVLGAKDPMTPGLSRPRSDTIMTTSSASSSSSPHLQTPQSPSILGVLSAHTRSRADSYDFEGLGKELFGSGISEEIVTNPQAIGVFENETLAHEMTSPPMPDAASARPAPLQLEPAPIILAPNDTPDESTPATPTDSSGPSSLNARPKAKRGVRTRLQRSKSSLKEVFRVKRDDPSDQYTDTERSSLEEGTSGGRRIRPRLRSLLSLSGSRSPSSTSIRSVNTASSLTAPGPGLPISSLRPLASPVDETAGAIGRDASTPIRSDSPQLIDDGHEAKERGLLQGQLIMTTSRMQVRSRPIPTSALSTGPAWRTGARPLAIHRSATDPVVSSLPLRMTDRSRVVEPKPDLFGTMLPRELKVMIFKKLLNLACEKERSTRWDGEVGSRKELIRLSRVSKDWQSLCFDGQLWPIMDLSPFASHLHPRTLRRIVDHARPFIITLSLRGMDALGGRDMASAIIGNDLVAEPRGRLPSLISLDLRGCKHLDFSKIVAVVVAAPNLRTINFKGLQGVTSEVIRTIARTSHQLESLDVSRCWDISLCDICVFIKMLSTGQAAKLKVLRVSGIKAYGVSANEFLSLVLERLVNLEVLDLLCCTHIANTDMIQACESLTSASRTSSIKHLILSGCSSLTADIFPAMCDVFPLIDRLELASLPNMFDENGQGSQGFRDFLISLPRLEKLDLDGTGTRGGVDDRMLDVLTPPKREVSTLTDLKIGYAKGVTPEGMIRFIRDCPTLRTFDADNTSATNSVMRKFKRHASADASLSLVDCRAITAVAYSQLASTSRPRRGFTGYAAVPMAYDDHDLDDKPVIKVFWSWRRVGIAKGWRDVLNDKEREVLESKNGSSEASSGAQTPMTRAGKGKGWWKHDDPFDDRAGCVVM